VAVLAYVVGHLLTQPGRVPWIECGNLEDEEYADLEVEMALLPLQAGIIYGPVNSRRLGRSLGINLLPTSYKLCSFDCVYCHYGRTQLKTLSPDASCFPAVQEVLHAVQEALQTCQDVDYLTFSGNGEATLHPHFPLIASGVRRLRDELRPEVKLAILSNSSTLHLPYIRAALAGFDAPIMKLDAGDPDTFARLNRPVSAVKLERILEGLEGVPGLIVQSVLVDGAVSNVQGEAFEAWLAALADVSPTRVQIYSTDRPVPEAGVERVSPSTLRRLAGEVKERTGLRVDAYWA
jgi:wyosine [tRNA(Phe)-imidazoG37] synthetase (radical SAM superfamily)